MGSRWRNILDLDLDEMAFLLSKRDHCVCELVQLTGKKRNLVSHHLAVMRKNNAVTPYLKSGLKYYKLDERALFILDEFDRRSN